MPHYTYFKKYKYWAHSKPTILAIARLADRFTNTAYNHLCDAYIPRSHTSGFLPNFTKSEA